MFFRRGKSLSAVQLHYKGTFKIAHILPKHHYESRPGNTSNWIPQRKARELIMQIMFHFALFMRNHYQTSGLCVGLQRKNSFAFHKEPWVGQWALQQDSTDHCHLVRSTIIPPHRLLTQSLCKAFDVDVQASAVCVSGFSVFMCMCMSV